MSGEKTEKPTPKKHKQNRKEGQVPRTQELGGWASMMLLGLALPMLLARELGNLRDLMIGAMTWQGETSVFDALAALREGAGHVFITLIVLSSGVMVVGVASALAQGGFYLATKQIKPTFNKLDPIKGAKRIFGPNVLWEGAKMLLKSSVVGLLVYASIKGLMPLIGGMVPISVVLDAVNASAMSLIRNVAIAGLVLGAADYAMQRRRIGKQTRMTKEEVKTEYKQTEGDPLLKSAIRSRQLANARNRMMADVPLADVVLVNPTHVAVALRYEAGIGAPRVVARGAGAVAASIRARAAEARIPLVQDIPLARSLYSSTTVGQSIPPELFAAVASVLAFVISRRSQGQYGGEHRSPRTEADLPAVPAPGRRRRNPSGPVALSRS